MNIIHLKVLGPPTALKRHRTVTLKNGVRINYDPSKGDKRDFLSLVQEKAPKEPVTSPVEMEITLFMPRPKAHYRTGKYRNELKQTAPHKHTKRPDIDNFIKFCLDSLNGVFFTDDSQVWKLTTAKVYDNKPRTEVVIRWE